MSRGPIRRAQLVSPFGPGALTVLPNGVSVIIAGLDYWYRSPGRAASEMDLREYEIEEWRLQEALDVDHFRLPPDFRNAFRGRSTTNTNLTVPALRFPRWHVCSRAKCHRLYQATPSQRERVPCPSCSTQKSKVYAESVGIIAICDHGHAQEFPWREWVHQSSRPTCQGQLHLVTLGGTSLSSREVRCDCGARRSLWNVHRAYEDGSTLLTKELDKDGLPYVCQGHQPWNGRIESAACGRPLRAAFCGAANIYYADVHSAIYLPRRAGGAPAELVRFLGSPSVRELVGRLGSLDEYGLVEVLRSVYKLALSAYADEQLHEALGVFQGRAMATMSTLAQSTPAQGATSQVEFRRQEFTVLREPRTDDQLRIRPTDHAAFGPEVRDYFARIMLVHSLRETRALAGFTRVVPTNDLSPDARRSLLWRHPERAGRWLPAYTVHGEGLYLEFDEQRLQAWEQRPEVGERLGDLVRRHQRACQSGRIREEHMVGPRFVLIHTFAHLLMNELTFECGYATAALRERLYVADDGSPMGGLLIYTAAGDSEGTLGGLVRLGRPGYLEPTIARALANARWCSADPVCMEIGEHGGQGPDSCNLAACHACALVPETSCELFNRFLDRGVVVGTAKNPDIGFFRVGVGLVC